MYEVIQHTSIEELTMIVNERMDAQWIPCGGVVVVMYMGHYLFLQAMYKMHMSDNTWYGKDEKETK